MLGGRLLNLSTVITVDKEATSVCMPQRLASVRAAATQLSRFKTGACGVEVENTRLRGYWLEANRGQLLAANVWKRKINGRRLKMKGWRLSLEVKA